MAMDSIHIVGLLALVAVILFDLHGGYVAARRAYLKSGPSSVPMVTLPIYLLVYGLNPEFYVIGRVADAILVLVGHFSVHIFIPRFVYHWKHE